MTIRSLFLAAAILAGVSASDEVLANRTNSENTGAIPPLFAVLLGGNEVSPAGEANAGDRNGRGSATVIVDETRVCFGIVVDGIDAPTAAHIHEGVAGVNGPIVVTLVPPTTGNPGASSGCVSVSDRKLLTDIQRRPPAFYVNVHTGQFPAGAVRGQLF